jgi:hypothetical protein
LAIREPWQEEQELPEGTLKTETKLGIRLRQKLMKKYLEEINGKYS